MQVLLWAQQEGLRDQLLAVRMLRAVMYTAVSCFCLFDPRMQVHRLASLSIYLSRPAAVRKPRSFCLSNLASLTQMANHTAETASKCQLFFCCDLLIKFCSWRKVLVTCTRCSTGASAGRVDSKTWSVRHLREGACAPCTGAVTANTTATMEWECCMMHETTSKEVCCMNPHQPHRFCVECFENLVSHLMDGEERGYLVGVGAKVLCPLCKQVGAHAFDMRVCASSLSQTVYGRYLACVTEAEVIKTQKEYDDRLARLQAVANRMAAGPESAKSECTSLFFWLLSCFISQAISSSILPLN